MKKIILTSAAVIFTTATFFFIARTSFAHEESKNVKNKYNKSGMVKEQKHFFPAPVRYYLAPGVDTAQAKPKGEGC
jgi:hypothetical protein